MVCPLIPAKTEVLLGITIGHELKFDDHVNYLCKKASLNNLMHLPVLYLL